MVLLWQMLLDKSSTAAAMREQQGFKSQQKLRDREDNKQPTDFDLREKSSKEGGAENRNSQLFYPRISRETRCLFIFNKDASHHSQCKGCGAKGAFNCSIAKHILTKLSSTGLRRNKLGTGQQHKTTTKPTMARLNRLQEIIVIQVEERNPRPIYKATLTIDTFTKRKTHPNYWLLCTAIGKRTERRSDLWAAESKEMTKR